MNARNSRRLICFLMLAWVTPCLAEDKLRVHVDHSGDDAVGRQLVFQVREAVRRSAAFQLVAAEDAMFFVNIVSLDPDKDREGSQTWTVAAVVYTMYNYLPLEKGNPQTWYPIYLGSSVVTSGKNAIDSSALSVVANLDRYVEELRSDARK